MSTSNENKPGPGPKPKYQKPIVQKIKLDSEVLLVAGCKLASGTLKGNWGCKGVTTCANKAAGS